MKKESFGLKPELMISKHDHWLNKHKNINVVCAPYADEYEANQLELK